MNTPPPSSTLKIYTDGACRGNPGPGGWGAFIVDGNNTRVLKGFEAQTTNNRMELTAVIEALASLESNTSIELFTDSKYVSDGVQHWLPKWKKNGWRTASKKPVKNKDLWQQLEQQATKCKVRWVWLRGHSGHYGNEKADSIANEAIDQAVKNG